MDWASSMESCNLPLGVVGLGNREVVGSLEDSVFRLGSKNIYIYFNAIISTTF